MPKEICVTLNGGPHDGFQIVWPGTHLMRFGESCYMVGPFAIEQEFPNEMIYLGESKSYTLPAQKEEANAG